MTKHTFHNDVICTLRLRLLEGPLQGLRQVDSPVSMVTVTAGPLATLNRYTKSRENNIGYMAYVCAAPAKYLNYIGYGYAERRMGERLTEENRTVAQAYVIHSSHPNFTEGLAQGIEDCLLDIARANGVLLANAPEKDGLGGRAAWSPEIAEVMRDVRPKLWFAGCRMFEQHHHGAQRNHHICAGVEVIEAGELPQDARPVQLRDDDSSARGYRVGPKKIIIPPDAVFNRTEKAGFTKFNTDRRTSILKAGILDDIPGDPDHARLRVWLAFESAAVAAKVITGKPVGNRLWRPAPTSTSRQEPKEQATANPHQPRVSAPPIAVEDWHG